MAIDTSYPTATATPAMIMTQEAALSEFLKTPLSKDTKDRFVRWLHDADASAGSDLFSDHTENLDLAAYVEGVIASAMTGGKDSAKILFDASRELRYHSKALTEAVDYVIAKATGEVKESTGKTA